MSVSKLHADEVEIDSSLVGGLLAAQFPRWADLSLTLVTSQAGTSNVLYRLGEDMVVRLPRTPGAADSVALESRWLSRLAPELPFAVPEVLGEGLPTDGYPLQWSVCRWLDGDDVLTNPDVDEHHAAIDLGRFIGALRKVDAEGPPAFRGGPLATRDAGVRAAVRDLGGTIDAAAATAAWEKALATPEWTGDPVWLHSDLLPGNLLARDGRLTAVIDFGACGVGDPACDTMPVWTVLSAETRPLFRAQVDVDDATWARGRGWALCFGLGAADYYEVRNPVFAALGRRVVGEVLAD
ncbi:aminoglycoside phosphotransferase family protein [Alloactinosynnema sp. L-07]|uniref:aminoglycoside phosphotransferase family protein n=1 Tax=Alloactinosynnema sp. L-07 TaxID=1653480 RepID=UPI0006B510CF|nr:aminoglycoside phosphotransferase family protein [Alloactinosynnema sp. L-07]